MRLDYDGLDDKVVGTPDLQKNAAGVDTSNSLLSKDSYAVTIENLPVKLAGKYNFVFNYYYKNPDDDQATPVLGPPSATYSIELTIPDLSEAPTNVVAVGGVSSYTVSWDKPTFKTYGDTIVYESDTNSFNSSSKVVFVGTDNQCSVITSDYNNKWVYVVHRDIFREAHKKGTVAGPITIKTADPDTTFTVANPGSSSASASIDPNDLSGFSLVSTITWAQSTDTKTAGYAIRWSTDDPAIVPTPLWEYASVSGRTTTSFTATGLIPNTTYYYQVASTTPYDVVNWTGAASGTFIASDADGTAAGALARLKSYIAIGGASQDLFKIGTGISQGINLNTDPLTSPSLTTGTYHGIILNKSTTNVGNNFWLTTGQFRVGNPTEFMYWNGTNLYLTGNVNATGGKFTGNVQLAIPSGSTTSGVLYAGSSPTTGVRVRFSSEGLFGYDALGETFKLQSSDGLMTASKGQIAGWTLSGTQLTKNNARLDSTGVIELGSSGTDNIIRLDANDATYRMWIGRNSSATAPFKVTKEGALTASGATINGNSTFYGTINISSALSDGGTIGDVKTAANSQASEITAVKLRVTNLETAGYQTGIQVQGTVNSGLATKNTTFYTSDSTAPSATRVGDLWINGGDNNEIYTAGAAGTGSWTKRTNTVYAKTTDLASKLNASAYVVQNSTNNFITMNTSGITIQNGNTTNGIIFNSDGIASYSGGNPTFVITSSGNATFYGNLSAATGTFTGRLAAGTTEATTGYLDTQGTKDNITTMVVKAIGHASTSNSGWTTSCYPWSASTYSLGTGTFPWKHLYTDGFLYFAASTTNYIGNTQGSTTVNAYLDGIALSAGTGVYTVGTATSFAPRTSGGVTLGSGSNRWGQIYSISTTISTSDQRLKTDIQTSPLGLDFINMLNPVSYKWIVGETKEVQEEKTILVDKKDEDGREWQEEKTILVGKEIGVGDDGKPIIETETRPGQRTHFGLIAQQVKEALEQVAPGQDFAGWTLEDVNDPNSTQSLRYAQFISPMIKAIQELSDMVQSLQEEVNTLKGI